MSSEDDDVSGEAPARRSPRRAASPAAVTVAEVSAERDVDEPVDIPWHVAGGPGTVGVQLRTTVRRLAMGTGLARRPGLVDSVRAIPGLPGLAVGPTGGSFAIGGPGWVGLTAVASPPPGRPMPLDWTVEALFCWLAGRLAATGLATTLGRVEGAWCPGFSDVAVGGRKLAGLGFRVTRERVLARGMLAASPVTEEDHALLAACHRLIGVEIDRDAATSLAEATGDSGWTARRAIALLAGT